MIHLTVVGAGPAYADQPGAVGACYLLRAAGRAMVLDLGHGAFAGLAHRVEPAGLAGVVVSHLHPDHFVDLVPLRHYLRYQRVPPARIRVVAPRALPERLDGLHGVTGFCAASLDCEPLAPGHFAVGPFAVEAANVLHDGDSYAFRVTAGETGPGLVYTGDCGRAADVRPLLRPDDTLLAEVSFGPGPGDPGAQHLDGPAVGRLAADGGARRVLLTHLLMGRDPAATIAAVRREYSGPVELVAPGFEAEID